MSESSEQPDRGGQAAPSNLEVRDPLKPFTDILDIVRQIAATGTTAPDPTAASLDLEAILRGPVLDPPPPPPPSAAPPIAAPPIAAPPIAAPPVPAPPTTPPPLRPRAKPMVTPPPAPEPAPEPEPDIEPEPATAPEPVVEPPVEPEPVPEPQPTPDLELTPPVASPVTPPAAATQELTDLQAIIDAASAAIAEIDGEAPPAPVTVEAAPIDPAALAALLASFDLPTDNIDTLLAPPAEPEAPEETAEAEVVVEAAPEPVVETPGEGAADTAAVIPEQVDEGQEEPAPPAPVIVPEPGEVVPPNVLAVLMEPTARPAPRPTELRNKNAPPPEPPPHTHRAVPPPPPKVIPDPQTDAAAAVLAAFATQQAEREALLAPPEAPEPSTDPAELEASEAAEDVEPTELHGAIEPPLPLVEPEQLTAEPELQETEDEEAPTHRRMRAWALKAVAAVVVLALMTGTGWAITRGPLARSASDPAPTPSPSASTGLPSVEVAPQQEAYAAVLAAVTSSKDLTALSAAADKATDLGQTFATLRGGTSAGQVLINAETAVLQSLSSLDALTPDNAAAQFPALMSTLQRSSSSVAKARKAIPGSDPSTDTSPAVDHVVHLVAPLALDGLTSQLTTFVRRAGAASKTADLREIAADAFQLRVATEDTSAVLGESGKSGERAQLLQRAVAALVSMKTIDGDHLDQWKTTGATLKQQLTGLGQSTAPLAKVDKMIDAATLLMKAWTELHSGVDKAALSTYNDKVVAAMKDWTKAWASLPKVTARQQPEFDLTTKFYRTSQALGRAVGELDGVKLPENSPDALVARNNALVALARRARAAAVAGHNVALAAEDCGTGCTYGETKPWQGFQRALSAVGDAEKIKAAWRDAYADAKKDAVDTTDVDADKPVV